MPALNRAMAAQELQRMIQLYLKAETDIINEIGRLRSMGLVDYHAEAALNRIQAILRRLESEGWEYIPKMIERYFYVSRPEARKRAQVQEEDEREKTIVNQSFQVAGVVCFFLSAAALFVVLPFSYDAFRALLAAMTVYALSFVLANVYFSKTL